MAVIHDNTGSSVNVWVVVAAIIVGIPLIVVGVVGVKTWVPLLAAGHALEKLDRSLGDEATYRPSPSGGIPAERMELFLELRTLLVSACDDYGDVQKGFDSVKALESTDAKDAEEVGNAALALGSGALAITPFLARFFELRNRALFDALMGLQEYAYIFAVAYHDTLLAEATLDEIFCDGKSLSPEASAMLKGCLSRQLEELRQTGGPTAESTDVEVELKKMTGDAARLIWQEGLPDAVHQSIVPYREKLDRVFCPATAGLEMEQSARRALIVALE